MITAIVLNSAAVALVVGLLAAVMSLPARRLDPSRTLAVARVETARSEALPERIAA